MLGSSRNAFAMLVLIAILTAISALAQSNLDVWVDENGHLWAENSFYKLDVTHGSSMILKTGTEWRDWRVSGFDSYEIELGHGGGNLTSPSYGVCPINTLLVEGIYDSGGQFKTAKLTGIFSTGQSVTLILTFYEYYSYVKMNVVVSNVSAVPNPPGICWRVSLVPGGDENPSDYYHYAGQSAEASFPYNSWTAIYGSDFQTVGNTEFAYITDYDKDARQGFAMITRLQETADFITDINYGRASIVDYHGYGGYASMSIHANSVVSPTVFWYFYETDPTTAYQPVEDLINSGDLALPTAWCDNFESSNWTDSWYGSGNAGGISIDNSIAYSGSSSLKMFGVIGSCWGAVATRPIQMSLPLEISLAMRNGNEALSGCHPFRSVLGLRTGGPDWWNCPCPQFLVFLPNGNIRIPEPSGDKEFSGYPLDTWHTIKCNLWTPGDGLLHVKLRVNGGFLGEFTWPYESWMTEQAYLDISSQEGTVWFDDVCINNSSCTAMSNISPNPQYVYWAYALNPMVDTVFLGNFTCGQSASDVDPSSVLLNGVVEPIGYNIISNKTGFSGSVLAIYYPLAEFMATYPTLYDTTAQIYTIAGEFTDGATFSAEGEVSIIGRKSHSPRKEFIMPVVKNELNLPLTGFQLQNHPNPFNPTTEINFALPKACDATLEVYNITGQKVATLVDGTLEAGEHTVQWDSRDQSGVSVASGIYLYRLTAGEFRDTKKMILLK